MALKDLVTGETTKSMVVGFAAASVAYWVMPALARFGRPLARAAVKSSIIFYEKARETAAEMTEVVEDLIAEARAELEEEEVIETEAQAEAGEAAVTATDTKQ